tara:strand:- start:250 stop:567 length:318 start_codon:yes stop_codon:yes gene_type:complete
MFKITGYKTFRGKEGVGAEANLYFDDSHIGWILDDGNGGGAYFKDASSDKLNGFAHIKCFLEGIADYIKDEERLWTINDFAEWMLNEDNCLNCLLGRIYRSGYDS